MRRSQVRFLSAPPSKTGGMRICGDVVRNGELERNRPKDAEYQALMSQEMAWNNNRLQGGCPGSQFQQRPSLEAMLSGLGTVELRNRTESPRVWRGGTWNPLLTLTLGVSSNEIGPFFGVIRLAERPLQWTLKTSARRVKVLCQKGSFRRFDWPPGACSLAVG